MNIKKIILITGIIMFYFLSFILAGPKVENVSVEKDEVKGILHIYYDLSGGKGGEYTVEIRLSSDGGKNFNIKPKNISGDTGKVSGSGKKHAIWDAAADIMSRNVKEVWGDKYMVLVTADDGYIPPTPNKITGRDGAEMVLIPAGEFWMGSPEGEGGGDEHPRHKVYLDAFYMDRYEVTVGQYRKFCKATGREMPEQPSWSSDKHPVVKVTWYEAKAYADYYGKELPTEAQWEKACRAGTDTEYYFGNSLSSEEARFGSSGAVAVGSYKPNAYGLYDMHGNVWEWCLDWYGETYYSNSPYKNPRGPDSGTSRVLRGGGWYSSDYYCRSAYRNWSNPGNRKDGIGFRCVARSGAYSF